MGFIWHIYSGYGVVFAGHPKLHATCGEKMGDFRDMLVEFHYPDNSE